MFNDSQKFNKEIELIRQAKQAGLSQAPADQAIQAKMKQSLLKAIANETNLPPKRYNFIERNLFMGSKLRYIVTTLAGLAIVGGTTFASNNAKPGDVLFPVRKAVENAQLALTLNEQAKAQLQTEIAQQRISDINAVPAQHQDAAKQEAQVEAKDAISVLTKVQADLQAKGNVTAATAIGENIARLKSEAQDHHLKIEATEEKENVEPAETPEPAENETEATDQKDKGDQNDRGQKTQQDQQDKTDSGPAGESASGD